MKKQKHHDIICAWARGESIEWRASAEDEWSRGSLRPHWYDSYEYRIKPETKELFTCMRYDRPDPNWHMKQTGFDNIKAVFDEKTHKLISVEIIK